MSARPVIRLGLGARLALVFCLMNLLVVSALGSGVYLWTENYLEHQTR